MVTLYDPNIDYLLLGHPSQSNIYLHAQVLTFVSKFKQPTLIPDARHRKDDPPYTEEREILRGIVFFLSNKQKKKEENIVRIKSKVAMWSHPKHPQVEVTLHIRLASNGQLSIAALPNKDPER